MKKILSLALLCLSVFFGVSRAAAAPPLTLVDPDSKLSHVNASDVIKADDGSYVEFDGNDPNHPWPGPIWAGEWNLEGCTRIVVDLENLEDDTVRFGIRIDDAAAIQNNANWFNADIRTTAKKRDQYVITIPTNFIPQLVGKLDGMRGLPGGVSKQGSVLEWKKILRIFVIAPRREKPVKYRVYSIKAFFEPNYTATTD